MTFFINLLVVFYLLLITPKILFDRVLKGKRHPGFLKRFGFFLPRSDKPVIWIHAVSVGEVKAAQSLFRELRLKEPSAFFLITTTSATGQAEARRSLSEADAFAYLPVDLTWVVKRWVKCLNPRKFILVESDFWFNLLSILKRNGTEISLVSGKLSEKSAARFLRFATFSKKLFSHFDHLCVQNEEHWDRFFPLVADPSKLHITGNIKLDLKAQSIMGTLELPQPVVTISCTHATEEELLIDALRGEDLFLILAPRHPERFEDVAHLLKKKNIRFTRWSQASKINHENGWRIVVEKDQGGVVLLIDAMGQLPVCYAHSRLAILGGSYIDSVGGHNVLEPCIYGTPVLFGPHMHGQIEFAKRAIDSGAGLQVSLDQIRVTVTNILSCKEQEKRMRRSAREIIEASRGSTLRTINVLFAE